LDLNVLFLWYIIYLCKKVLSIVSMFNLSRLLTYALAELIFHYDDYTICIYLLLEDLRVTNFYNISSAQVLIYHSFMTRKVNELNYNL
jgi:hypothetical protein